MIKVYHLVSDNEEEGNQKARVKGWDFENCIQIRHLLL